MEKKAAPEAFDPMKSPLKEAYELLNAKTPLELNGRYAEEDQKLFPALWDYENPGLITNKIKDIAESVDPNKLTEEEREWRQEILWFWYHHAISCALWRHKDKKTAETYAAKALSLQSEDHPNQITRLLYFLTRDELRDAEDWAARIEDTDEKETALAVIDEYKQGLF